MRRVIIIDSSGSGMSYLARRLGEHMRCSVVDLDMLFWEPGGYPQKPPKEIVQVEFSDLACGARWIAEVVFGKLAKLCFARADSFIKLFGFDGKIRGLVI